MPPKDSNGKYIWNDLWEGRDGWTLETIGIQWVVGTNTTIPERYGVNDVHFAEELLNRLETQYNIDKTRIYATGWSSGGMFVSQLAVKLHDKFAGIISASGGTIKYDFPYKPINFIQTVGEIEDESIRPSGVLSCAESAAFWAKVNKCDTGVVFENDKYIRTTYGGGTGGTQVVFYVVKSQGHAWPNQVGGLDPQTIWNLLKDQKLKP